jgi:uncharacterized protein (DUF1810 family)
VTEADLIHFVNAQAQVYRQVAEELTDGCKRTLSLPKTRFVRTGDAILPRLHGRRCPPKRSIGRPSGASFPSET